MLTRYNSELVALFISLSYIYSYRQARCVCLSPHFVLSPCKGEACCKQISWRIVMVWLSNGQRARSLRTRPQKRVSMKMVGLFTTKATIKMMHFRRGARSNRIKNMFLATIAGGKTAAPDNCKTTLRRREDKLKKTEPEPAVGWVLIGWVLGCSLIGAAALLGFQQDNTLSHGLCRC